MTRHLVRRPRALVALSAVLGLGLTGAACVSTAGAAQSAAPAGDCATPFPVAELAAGDSVTGLTVTHGTTPEGFTGTVLGVVDDGIGPDLDMIMVRLSSPEIDKAGIWQGMSGSPVYAGDGRLIGAVSYSLAMGSSPVAGVTPYEDMDDYLGTAPDRVGVDRATARQLARRTDVSAAAARQGFEQIPMPLGVAGVGAARLAAAGSQAAGHPWLPRSTYAMGRAGDAASAADIVAGGNLAATISYGDVTMGGVGTVTSVCGDRVVGWGHPMELFGRTTLGLHPADAVYIQEDLVSGFKVANFGALAGTITDDRLTGITGTLGALPDTVEVSSTLTYGARTRTGVTQVVQTSPDALATATFYGLIANHQAVVDGPAVGSEDLTWTITGTDANGKRFKLSSGDLYSSTEDLSGSLGYAIGDLVYGLARTPGISIDSIATEGVLRDQIARYKVGKISIKQHGAWVTSTRRNPVTVGGGRTLRARVELRHNGEVSTLQFDLVVPKRFSGRLTALEAIGGAVIGGGRLPKDIDAIKKALAERPRSDEILVALTRGPALEASASASVTSVAHPRSAGSSGTVRKIIGPVDGIVRGYSGLLVQVR